MIIFALLLALCLIVLSPAVASAHAVLLRSDPAQDAVLASPPHAVRMWFSEDLNPTFSTATVINGQRQRADAGDAHVSPGDTKEMDLTLKADLPPAVYIVVYRTHSAADGHTLSGSFLFTVARPDGTVPTLSSGQKSSVDAFGAGTLTNSASGQLDGPTVFTFLATTLIELGVVFWVGAQLWSVFVFPRVVKMYPGEQPIGERMARRFERYFSLPLLLTLLLANVGVLVGQALSLTGGNWAGALSPSLLIELATAGRFGLYWVIRGALIVIAIAFAYLAAWRWQHKHPPGQILHLLLLSLGVLLMMAIGLSGHAAAVDNDILIFSVLGDWLHLVAAALWIGGMFYIATVYLPALSPVPSPEQTRSLLRVIPCFSPLAITGVLLMSITGPFSATIHLSSWDQFLATAYGRTLLLKIALVGALLLTSAYHVGLVRPRLRKAYTKYVFATTRLQTAQTAGVVHSHVTSGAPAAGAPESEPSHEIRRVANEVKQREKRISGQTRRLMSVLRYEPLLGVAVLVCVGLMNVFGGTLASTEAAAPPTAQAMPLMSQPFAVTSHTTDGRFTVILGITPDRSGTNEFVVRILDSRTYLVVKNAGVALYTTMLDMEMGTSNVNLQPDGKGYFRAKGDLTMSGHWQIRVQIRAIDNTLHEITISFSTLS